MNPPIVQFIYMGYITVDGKWGQWGEWSSCSHSCGEGSKWRTRQCDNPAPDGTGVDCVGVNNKTAACIYMQCGEYPGECIQLVIGDHHPDFSWSNVQLSRTYT